MSRTSLSTGNLSTPVLSAKRLSPMQWEPQIATLMNHLRAYTRTRIISCLSQSTALHAHTHTRAHPHTYTPTHTLSTSSEIESGFGVMFPFGPQSNWHAYLYDAVLSNTSLIHISNVLTSSSLIEQWFSPQLPRCTTPNLHLTITPNPRFIWHRLQFRRDPSA